MIDKIPPEITNPILEIVSYVFAVAMGWLAKLLQGRQKKERKQD